jgi:hypothetical protein
MQHCSDEELLSYQDRELDESEAAEVKEHLGTCWQCRARLAVFEERICRLAESSSRSVFPGAAWRTDAHERLQSSIRRWENAERNNLMACMGAKFASWWHVGAAARSRLTWAAVGILATVVSFVVFLSRPPKVEARALLLQSSETERRGLSTAEAHHRVWEIEERRSGHVSGRCRVDLWQGRNARPSARRVFDDHQQLIAGQWIPKVGTPTLYRKNTVAGDGSSRLVPVPHDLNEAALLDFSAKQFLDLLGSGPTPQIYRNGPEWTVQIHAGSQAAAGSDPRLLHAKLVLSGTDLRPTEEELIIGASSGPVEYRMRETTREVFVAQAPSDRVFARDSAPDEAPPELRAFAGNPVASGAPTHAVEESAAPANVALELDVLTRLALANLVLGRQAKLERRPNGGLTLFIVAASNLEKDRILNDLGALPGEPQLTIRFKSSAEFAKQVAAHPMDAEHVIVPPLLYAWVADGVARDGLTTGETEITHRAQAESVAILENAERMRAHSFALREISRRFDQKQIDSLDADQTSRWLALWSQYLSALQIESASLLKRLAPIFGDEKTESNGSGRALSKDRLFDGIKEVVGGVEQIYQDLEQSLVSSPSATTPAPLRNTCPQLRAVIVRISEIRAAIER